MRVSSKIIIDDRWHRYEQELERATVRSLAEAAGIGVAAARGKPSRYRIDQIKNTIRVLPPIRIPGGWMVTLSWPDFRARFFEKGTYQHRRGKLRRPRRSDRANQGVTAQHFASTARRLARLALIERLNRNLR